ncbi:MAG: recombinase family protein [bacterium]
MLTLTVNREKKVALYLRVSTLSQSTELQSKDLLKYIEQRGWSVAGIYEDKASGVSEDKRPQFKKLLEDARLGKFDIVVCHRLDRLSRSLKDLVNTLQFLAEHNVEFVSFKDNIDLTTATGRLMMNIIASMAEFEASLIKERVRAGLILAKQKGKILGRPKKDCPLEQIKELKNKGHSIRQIAKHLCISTGMVQRAIA